MKPILTLLTALLLALCSGNVSAALHAGRALTWEPAPGWQTEKDVLSSNSNSNDWSVIESRDTAQDGCISGKLTIAGSAPMSEPEGPSAGVFCGNDVATAPFEKRYEASVIFRQTATGCYRVGFSLRDQEVSLWRTDGGFLAVKQFPIKAAEETPFLIEFSGGRFKVSVGGRDAIDFLDLRPALSPGRIGLANIKGDVAFHGVALGSTSLDPAKGVFPVAFSQRKWHGRNWFFNGLEPIACLSRTLYLNCKIGACYRMIGSTPAFWLQWMPAFQGFANKQERLEVRETGAGLKCLIEGRTPGGEIVSDYLMTITFDKASRCYVYDFDTEFTVQVGKTWRNACRLEFSDFTPYNAVGPSVTPGAWPCYYQWVIWQSKDGNLYKHPINHDSYYPRKGGGDDYYLIKEGGFIGFFGEEVNPVTRLIKSQYDVSHGLCNWAHDLHIDYPMPKEPMAAGTKYAIHFQLLGIDKAGGDKLMAKATFPPDAWHLDWAYPVFKQGVNDFRTGATLATPRASHLWRKGCTEVPWYDEPVYWDRTTGVDDKDSIRIDGPFSVGAPIGNGAFMPPFSARRYHISAMVRTEHVKGSSPCIGLYRDSNEAPVDQLQTGLLGTHDWTRVGWITDKLTHFENGWLRIGLPGTGRVWFDNVTVEALKDGETTAAPVWGKQAEPSPLPGLLVWLKMDDGAGAGALDYSYHGNSAELRGLKWVKDEERGTCVEGDGSGMALIESKPELDFTTPYSFSCWFKPSAGNGVLFRKYNNISVAIYNEKGPFRIGFNMNGRYNVHQTESRVPAGSWVHLVVTHDGTTVRIYLNGVKVWEKDQPETKVVPNRFPLCIGGFWHGGKVAASNGFRGRLKEIKFYSTALSDAEIEKAYEAGKTPGAMNTANAPQISQTVVGW